MAFTLPKFNLMAGIWHKYLVWPTTGQNPPVLGPNVTTQAQLYRIPRSFEEVNSSSINPWPGGLSMVVEIRFPPGTDVRDPNCYPQNGFTDVVEIPLGSGRYYQVAQVEDAHKGFPNEYRIATGGKAWQWPFPIP